VNKPRFLLPGKGHNYPTLPVLLSYPSTQYALPIWGYLWSLGTVSLTSGNFLPMETGQLQEFEECRFKSLTNTPSYPLPERSSAGVKMEGEK
jgi:hypothetical protein